MEPEFIKLTYNRDVRKTIECSGCQEVPFPPVYMCINWHNICNLCKPKLQICPSCENVISDTRNSTVEAIVLTGTHSCAFKDDGCKIKKSGAVLREHIKVCQYRSFICGRNRSLPNCEGVSVKLSQAREHFLATHKSITVITDSKCIRTVRFTSFVEDHSKFKQDLAFSPGLIEHDGKTFLVEIFAHEDLVYWTLFCIGTEKEAGKYRADITFSSEKKNVTSFHWKFPVQPIIKCEELRDGNEMKDEVIPSCSFKDFKKVAVRDDGISKYVFHTEYKIYKQK